MERKLNLKEIKNQVQIKQKRITRLDQIKVVVFIANININSYIYY